MLQALDPASPTSSKTPATKVYCIFYHFYNVPLATSRNRASCSNSQFSKLPNVRVKFMKFDIVKSRPISTKKQ